MCSNYREPPLSGRTFNLADLYDVPKHGNQEKLQTSGNYIKRKEVQNTHILISTPTYVCPFHYFFVDSIITDIPEKPQFRLKSRKQEVMLSVGS